MTCLRFILWHSASGFIFKPRRLLLGFIPSLFPIPFFTPAPFAPRRAAHVGQRRRATKKGRGRSVEPIHMGERWPQSLKVWRSPAGTGAVGITQPSRHEDTRPRTGVALTEYSSDLWSAPCRWSSRRRRGRERERESEKEFSRVTDEKEVRVLDRSVEYIIDGKELKFFRRERSRVQAQGGSCCNTGKDKMMTYEIRQSVQSKKKSLFCLFYIYFNPHYC